MGQLEGTKEWPVATMCKDLDKPAAALMNTSERLLSLLRQKGLEQDADRAESILRNVRLLNLMIQELALTPGTAVKN